MMKKANLSELGISVIICCYNGAFRLPQVLKYLASQKFNDPWEIIFIDNNSEDNSANIALSDWERHNIISVPLYVYKEETPGQMFARRLGIKMSNYKYLVFCDDDNWLSEYYLTTGFKILIQNSRIGVLGGIASPVFGGSKPSWFDKYQTIFAVGKQLDTQGDITNIKGWVYGAGIFINKDALSNFEEYKFLTTGRSGKHLTSGDDIELCYYILSQGFKVWYDERLTFFHFMEGNRLNIKYLMKMMLTGAKSSYLLDGLTYRVGAKVGWYNKWYKRSWIFRLIRDSLDLRKFYIYRELPFAFLLKIHFIKLLTIIKLNFKYDYSFKDI